MYLWYISSKNSFLPATRATALQSIICRFRNVPRGTLCDFVRRGGPASRSLCARLVNQRQRRRGLLFHGWRCLQFQLLLPAERGHFPAIGFQVTLRRLECFLCLVQILADILELVLEKVEGLLRLR